MGCICKQEWMPQCSSPLTVSYDQNILLIFLCERWIPCQAVTSAFCLLYSPETVHCSTKEAYNSEITFLTLHPWVQSTAARVNIQIIQTSNPDAVHQINNLILMKLMCTACSINVHFKRKISTHFK